MEELQNIALQIRKEQLSLELQYEGKTNKGENVLIASDEIVLSTKKSTKSDESQIVCKVDDATSEKSIRSRGIDIMQIIDPNVVKTSDELTPSLSNIRVTLLFM